MPWHSPSIQRHADSPTTAAAAPSRSASGACWPPSALSPRTPTNRLPATISRESTYAPSTSVSGVPTGSRASAPDLQDLVDGQPHAPALPPTTPPISSRATIAVVERRHHPVALLPLLVALAGDHHHVARGARPRRPGDRGPPVGLHHGPGRAVGHAGQDLGDDRLGLLGARVVRGDDRHVGEAPRPRRPSAGACPGRGRRRSRSTQISRPLARQLAGRPQHVLERVGRVRVVDDHGKGWPPSTASKRPGTPGTDAIPAATASCGSPSSSPTATAPGDVGQVEAPAQAALDLDRPARGRDARARCPCPARATSDRAHRRRARPPRSRARPASRGQAAAELVVQVGGARRVVALGLRAQRRGARLAR